MSYKVEATFHGAKVYLAGPMTGYAEFNFPAFHKATAQLREAGYQVFSPAEHDESQGIDVTGTDGTETLAEQGFSRRTALGADLAWICAEAEAVVVLPGWNASTGALAEVATARALGLPVWPLAAAI